MLAQEFTVMMGGEIPKCVCCERPSQVAMIGYAESSQLVVLCSFHALQLSRKILEDLCELAGDRHG